MFPICWLLDIYAKTDVHGNHFILWGKKMDKSAGLSILRIHPFCFSLLSAEVLLSQQNIGGSQKGIFIAVQKWYFLVCMSYKNVSYGNSIVAKI